MSVDFENKPLRDENGKKIRTADGKPVLYKHFLNDLPDEEHSVYPKLSNSEKIAEWENLGIEPPEDLLKSMNDKEKSESPTDNKNKKKKS